MFDFIEYIKELIASNKLAMQKGFEATTCSGINYLEGMLEQYQTTANFVCTADTCQESTFQQSGGWFKRRVYTVFILARHEYGNMEDYASKLALCREIFRQLQSRFLRDSELLQTCLLYLHTEDIRSNELGATFLNGCTGLYFMLSMDEPTDITYNPEEWYDTSNK